MTKPLTYRQLSEKLQDLGYTRQTADMGGTRQWLFRHPGYPRATIFLPETPLDEPVTPMHLGAVRAVLTNHDVIEVDSDQLFLQALAANEKGRSGKS